MMSLANCALSKALSVLRNNITFFLFSQKVKEIDVDSSSCKQYFVTSNLCYKRYSNKRLKYFVINIFYPCY